MQLPTDGKLIWWNNPGETTLTPEEAALLPGLPALSLSSAIAKAVAHFARKNINNDPRVTAHMRKPKGFKFVSTKREIKYAVAHPVIKNDILELPVIFDVVYDRKDKLMSIIGAPALPPEDLAPLIATFRALVNKYMQTYSSTEMSLGLRSVLAQCNAVQVRRGGTVYFIKDSQLPKLKEISDKLAQAGVSYTLIDIPGNSPNFDTVREGIAGGLRRELELLAKHVKYKAKQGMTDGAYRANLNAIKEIKQRMNEYKDFGTEVINVLGQLDVLYAGVSQLVVRNKPEDLGEIIANLKPVDVVDIDTLPMLTDQDVKPLRTKMDPLFDAPMPQEVFEISQVAPPMDDGVTEGAEQVNYVDRIDKSLEETEADKAKAQAIREKLAQMDTTPSDADFSWANYLDNPLPF